MFPFDYHQHELRCERVPLARLAQAHGTPLYVYSAAAIRENYRRLAAAFAPLRPLICYAVKANFNLALLSLLQAEGAGFDIVSGGELARALKIGADPARVVFAGVGKTDSEIRAALAAGIGWFNVESADELARLNSLASQIGRGASGGRPPVQSVALRLNPGVEPDTHHHIQTGGSGSKFGLPPAEALALVRRAAEFPALALRGAHIHIGSQVPDPASTLQAIEVALQFIEEANSRLPPPAVPQHAVPYAGPQLDHLDLGGGFPVPYRDTDRFPSIEEFAAPLVARLQPLADKLSFQLEPGRFLVANAGALVTTVQAVKNVSGRRTLVVDAGMNDLLRPALYDAYHAVLPLKQASAVNGQPADVVGPICESADILARDRDLPELQSGDQIAFLTAGAYGFSMASNYNSQPRPAEVLVEGGAARLIRRRETVEDLMALEEWAPASRAHA